MGLHLRTAALNVVYCAVSPDAAPYSGGYLQNLRFLSPGSLAVGGENNNTYSGVTTLSQRVWQATEKLLAKL